jgi:hypothetical protein
MTDWAATDWAAPDLKLHVQRVLPNTAWHAHGRENGLFVVLFDDVTPLAVLPPDDHPLVSYDEQSVVDDIPHEVDIGVDTSVGSLFNTALVVSPKQRHADFSDDVVVVAQYGTGIVVVQHAGAAIVPGQSWAGLRNSGTSMRQFIMTNAGSIILPGGPNPPSGRNCRFIGCGKYNAVLVAGMKCVNSPPPHLFV